MYVYNLVVFLCCMILTVGLTEARLLRTRRGACEHGTYQHEGRICCLCPRGYRVIEHCTVGNETQCKRCDEDTYMDHNNNDDKCRRCKVCDSSANMETKMRCSEGFDTICRCKENHYCEKADLCKTCSICDSCEHGVKQQCTETNNTVCNEATNTGAIVAGVIVVLILLAATGGVLMLWNKRKFCFNDEKSKDAPKDEEDRHLNDAELDLKPYLSEIADVLGWRTMKRVAQRSGMTNTDIEQHELNHPNDVKEQTYNLLQAWYQSQGLYQAYPALIKTLHRLNEKTTADRIQVILKEAISQP